MNKDVYNKCLLLAAKEDHEAIVEMMLDLRVNNYEEMVIEVLEITGNFNIIKRGLELIRDKDVDYDLSNLYYLAIDKRRLKALKYLFSLEGNKDKSFINSLSAFAGEYGNGEIIVYIVSKEGSYVIGLSSAVSGENLKSVKYLVTKTNKIEHEKAILRAIEEYGEFANLELLKYFVDEVRASNYDKILNKLQRSGSNPECVISNGRWMKLN